jgi:hypothetical protein
MLAGSDIDTKCILASISENDPSRVMSPMKPWTYVPFVRCDASE